MNLDLLDAMLVAHACRDAAAEVAADGTVTDSGYPDALAAALRARADRTATMRRLAAAFAASDASAEAQDARAAAKAAEAQARAARQRQHDEQIGHVIEVDSAKAAVVAAEKALAESEAVAREYDDPHAPRREKVLARGALEGARRDLDAARARLADLEKPPKGTA